MTENVSPLTDREILVLRAILKGFSAPEWRALKAIAGGVTAATQGAPGVSGVVPAVAPASELSSSYGDPKVKRDPNRWAGASYKGAHFSQCPTDFLIVLAEQLEYFAAKNKDNPNAKKSDKGVYYWTYDLKDAARARGWAARNQGKDKPPPVADTTSEPSDDPTPDHHQSMSHDADENWTPS